MLILQLFKFVKMCLKHIQLQFTIVFYFNVQCTIIKGKILILFLGQVSHLFITVLPFKLYFYILKEKGILNKSKD